MDVTVGISTEPDSFEAGKEAALQAIGHDGMEPDALIVFASSRYDHRRLLAGITSLTGETPMVGGSTAGEISTAGFTEHSIVLMALRSKSLRFISGLGKKMSTDERVCGVALAEDLCRQTPLDGALSLLIFPNGMGGDGVEVIDGLHSVLGDKVEIVGGFLGDDVNFENTFQFYDGKVYRDGITGLLLINGGKYQTGIGVRSGFESIGNRFYCTEADGHTVMQFDDEPALSLYKDFLGEERSERLPEVCLEYPFGMIDQKVSIAGEEYFQLRCGLQVDHEKKTITLAGSIPEGSAITLTTASRGDIINGARLAAEQARDCLRGSDAKAVLMFSCVGRKLVLGRRTDEEVAAVREVLGESVPLIGLYTYGEIGPIDKTQERLSSARFHNETVVIWVLGS